MKTSTHQLAAFGGDPAFTEPRFVGRPNIGDRDNLRTSFEEILDSRWLTNNGQKVKDFERALADLLGVKHCIAICNATVALEIVIRALELKGEVIVPSFTFVATAHALQWLGIKPVFCDIDPKTHNLDPRRVEELITAETTAIMGVHVWGRPCAIDQLTEIARRRNLKLVFDAAHAFGCSYRGDMIGRFGDAEVFSFHATKFFNTIEGGAITTNNDELATRIRHMKNFGFSGYDNVDFLGINGKMTEFSAAMGLVSLASMNEFIAINRRYYDVYRSELKDVSGVTVIDYDPDERNNYHYVAVEIDEALAGISRDDLVTILHAERVIARKYFYPGCHRMEPYRTIDPASVQRLPETELLSSRTLLLPNGSSLSDNDVREMAGIIQFAVANAGEIVSRLRERQQDDVKSIARP